MEEDTKCCSGVYNPYTTHKYVDTRTQVTQDFAFLRLSSGELDAGSKNAGCELRGRVEQST